MADLQTIRGVELVRVGTWETATHPDGWTVTAADLASAVAAHNAGVLRKPVVKIGHEDPRFDGSPALGRLDNLRVDASGQVLIGDLVDVPKAIAKLLSHAYPDRSVEALQNFTGPDGITYPLVLTGLALLGATAPGVDSLAAVTELYDVAASRITIQTSVFAGPDKVSSRSRTLAVAAARRTRNQRILKG